MIWAAGLYEGEGCLNFHPRVNNPTKLVFTVAMRMADEDVIKRFHSVFPFGRFTGPYQLRPHWKPVWQYQVTIPEDTYALCMAIYPFLGVRRQKKIEEFVELFKHQKRVYKRAIRRA